MNTEFRQRSIGEYLEMLWRHKLAVVLPALAVGIAVFYVVSKLPNMYESKAKLQITPPTIKAVQQSSDDDIALRINAITEEVTSRSSLEPMITKFALFEAERATGTPMELLVDRMRRSITVETTKGGNDRVDNLSLAYKDRDPNKARDITAELASKYIRRQQEETIKSNESTSQFFADELAKRKTRLDEIDAQRLNYMMQHVDVLPSGSSGLIAQLQNYGNEAKLLRDRETSVNTEIGRLRDQIGFMAREQNNLREYADKDEAQQRLQLADVNRNPAYVELKKRKSELSSQLTNLLTQYRPAHPDVVAKRNEIEQVNRDLAELEQQAKTNVEEVRRSSQGSLDLRLKNYDNEKQRLESEIRRRQQELQQIAADNQRIQAAAVSIQTKLNSVPSSEVALSSFDREYQTAKTEYDELLKKKNEVDLQTESARNNKGESIKIVDPASTPQAPVNASKRYLLMAAGVGLGLAIGLLLAFLLELPRFSTINNLADVKHYTELPVLAAVPELVTRREARWQRSMNLLRITTGVVAAAVSIPLLVVVLQVTRIFERFVS